MTAQHIANPGWVFSAMPGQSGRESGLVLVCYLDDSDNDRGPVAGIAGYASSKQGWEAFEREADPFLDREGIEVLHATDFHRRRGPFRDWEGERKAAFLEQLYSIAGRHLLTGISASVSKADFKSIITKERGLQHMSPLGLAFGTALMAILTKFDLPDSALPVTVLVEGGHRNNGNIEKYFHWLRANKDFPEGILGALTFVQKQDCRAIQLADFLAFHARRAAEVWDASGYPGQSQLASRLG